MGHRFAGFEQLHKYKRVPTHITCDCYHVQLSVLLDDARDGHSGEHGRGQSQVGVDGSSVLPVAMVCDGGVEAGPEHPEEEGAWRKRSRVSV